MLKPLTFGNPGYLILLLVIPLLVVWYFYRGILRIYTVEEVAERDKLGICYVDAYRVKPPRLAGFRLLVLDYLDVIVVSYVVHYDARWASSRCGYAGL